MRSKLSFWMGIYFTICFLAQIWPLAAFANRIEPFVLGLPFLFFWYIAWVFIIFVGYVITYLWEKKNVRL